MNVKFTNAKFGRWFFLAAVLILMLVTVVAAQAPVETSWATVCHTPPGNPTGAQTMQIAWSALDKYLSHFGDYLGSCAQ